MLKNEHIYRLTKAGVLAALSAVPISVGVTSDDTTVQATCIVVGTVLWIWAVLLLFPGTRPRPPKTR